MFSIIQPLFLQKLSQSQIFIWDWDWNLNLGRKKIGIYPSRARSPCSPLKHAISEIISPHFDTSEAEGLEREEIPYIGCGSCP